MIWMGLFMAPGLPLLNLVKLIAIFYIKSWAVLVTNVPHETVFKVIPIINWHCSQLLDWDKSCLGLIHLHQSGK